MVVVIYRVWRPSELWVIVRDGLRESGMLLMIIGTPILMPVITALGFDPIWFGVILTINMELGLITPPVGLNLFVINGITPDVTLGTILRGAFPFMLCMIVAIVLLCFFPEIATWLPQKLMG